MKIVVFGANGRTGRHVVEQALFQGHHVTAFVRHVSKIKSKHNNLVVFEGNVQNLAQVEKAVKGSEAVVSALGHTSYTSKEICSEGIDNIIKAMQKYRVKRLVSMSAYGAGETKKGFYSKLIWMLLKNRMIDKERMEELIRKSKLDWTIVRPVMLTNNPGKADYGVGENLRVGLFSKISRADVAHFMVKELRDKEFVHKTPTISY